MVKQRKKKQSKPPVGWEDKTVITAIALMTFVEELLFSAIKWCSRCFQKWDVHSRTTKKEIKSDQNQGQLQNILDNSSGNKQFNSVVRGAS